MQLVVGASPLFLERGRGCRVWDVDGNEYLDYVLGLLPVVLGYGDRDVDTAIRAQLDRGITLSLATELEIELSELLVEIIPCAEMVRFGKNGSDATSAAIRLARAATSRERVAVCGYHGWHDWYIGTTTRSLGVPTAVRELSSAFGFNDAASLEQLLDTHPREYAAVMLEPSGVQDPEPGFLESVRQLTHDHGAVLVFDEIVTGFRVSLGGAQERWGVVPDLATFGKAMGNGMPISAVVGRADLMRLMEEIFYSGTFSGETLSLTAALATIRKLRDSDGLRRIHDFGAQLREGMREAVQRHSLSGELNVIGPSWWPRVRATGEMVPADIATSLLRQELVEAGILSIGGMNLCLAHVEESVVDETLAAWDRALAAVADAYESGDPGSRLRGEPIRPVFAVREGA